MTDNLEFTMARWQYPENELCNFQIAIPQDSRQVATGLATAKHFFHRLAAFDSNCFQVRIGLLRSNREVNPLDILELSLESKQSQLQLVERRETVGGHVGEILLNGTTSKQHLIGVEKQGSRIFQIECAYEDAMAEELRPYALSVVRSFEVGKPEEQECAEETIDHDLTDSLKVRLPELWDCDKSVVEDNYRRIDFATDSDAVLQGRITVEVDNRTQGFRAADWFEMRREGLNSAGYHVGGAIQQRLDEPSEDSTSEDWLYNPPVTGDSGDYSAPTWLAADDKQVVVVSLLGPSRESSGYWWAVNKRAFEIACESLKYGPLAIEKPPKPTDIQAPTLSFPNAGTMPSRV